MSPEEFRNAWVTGEERLVRFPRQTLESLRIPEDSKEFLLAAGLPEEAAPFLSFEAPGEGPLPTAVEQWKLPADFARYRVIGSTGSGDPVCIDESADGAVVYLNHDARFSRVFVNSSVRHLAESLLAYRAMIQETQDREDEDGYLEGNISPELFDRVRAELARIDPPAMQEGCFWWEELSEGSQIPNRPSAALAMSRPVKVAAFLTLLALAAASLLIRLFG